MDTQSKATPERPTTEEEGISAEEAALLGYELSAERIVPATLESTPAPARFIENLKPAETEPTTEEGEEELVEKYVLNVEWRGDDYGKRKGYYRDAYLAGLREGRRMGQIRGEANAQCYQDTCENQVAEISILKHQLAAAQSEVSLAKQDLESYRREMKIHKEAAQAEIEELRNVEASLAHANHQLEVDRDRLRELVKAAEEALVRLLEIEPDPGELGGHYDDCAIADRDDGEGGEPECDCGVSDRWTKAAEALARLRSGKASEMQADRQERECLRCGLKQRRELR